MKHLTILVLGLLISVSVSPQNQERFIVKLKDKQTKAYSIHQPEAFLSKKALERRERYNIAIDTQDLPVSPEYVDELRKAGYTVTHSVKWLNTLIVKGQGSKALTGFDFVADVRQAAKRAGHGKKPFFEAESVAEAPYDYRQSDDENIYDYGQAYNQIAMLNGHLVHNEGYDGEGMTIAVLDAGFRKVDQIAAFDSLWANGQIIDTRNFVNNEDVFSPTISSHGMHVLSTMGGYLPGQLVGTAPRSDYYLVRTEDASDEYLLEEYYWVDGAEYADSVGADIINSSLGYTNGFNDPDNNHTYEDMDGNTTPVTIGADEAAQKGILVVNSAGNSGNGSWKYIGGPADGDSVFTIGAVDGDSAYVSFSSVGPTYDGRLKPNVMAKGLSATVASEWGGVTYASGTSFSSPITAGMVASVWQAMSEKSNMEVMELIEENSHLYQNPDTLMGYGIPDYEAVLNATGTWYKKPARLSVDVGPNPFRDRVKVVLEARYSKIHFALYNSAGSVVAEGAYNNVKQFEIDGLDGLPAGLYVLNLRRDDDIISRKLMHR